MNAELSTKFIKLHSDNGTEAFHASCSPNCTILTSFMLYALPTREATINWYSMPITKITNNLHNINQYPNALTQPWCIQIVWLHTPDFVLFLEKYVDKTNTPRHCIRDGTSQNQPLHIRHWKASLLVWHKGLDKRMKVRWKQYIISENLPYYDQVTDRWSKIITFTIEDSTNQTT